MTTVLHGVKIDPEITYTHNSGRNFSYMCIQTDILFLWCVVMMSLNSMTTVAVDATDVSLPGCDPSCPNIKSFGSPIRGSIQSRDEGDDMWNKKQLSKLRFEYSTTYKYLDSNAGSIQKSLFKFSVILIRKKMKHLYYYSFDINRANNFILY